MRIKFLKVFIFVSIFLANQCIAYAKDASFIPSIQQLATSETLVVNIEACHWDCQIGSIEIKGAEDKTKNKSLMLLPNEIAELDEYFLQGDDNSYCSLPILIDFEKVVDGKVTAKHAVQVFPCSYGNGEGLNPLRLLHFLDEEPYEIPYWRLSPDQQVKRNSLE